MSEGGRLLRQPAPGDSGVFSDAGSSSFHSNTGSFKLAALGFGMNGLGDMGSGNAGAYDSGVDSRRVVVQDRVAQSADARGLFAPPEVAYMLPPRPSGRPWYEAGIWPFKTKIVMEKGEPHLEGTLKIQFLNTFNKAAVYNGMPSRGARTARRLTIVGCPVDDYSMRTLLARSLLGLEDFVNFIPSENWCPATLRWALGWNLYVPNGSSGGWALEGKNVPSTLYRHTEAALELQGRILETGKIDVWELYVAQDHSQSGRVTLPLLWDSGGHDADGDYSPAQIVTNESASICRVLNKQLRAHSTLDDPPNLRPAPMATEIDMWNEEVALLARQVGTSSLVLVRGGKNNLSQTLLDFVERAQLGVYEQLNKLERRLTDRQYVNGDALTETDLRLYPLLVRFDASLFTFYRLSARGRIRDSFPHLQAYIQRMYAIPEVRKVTRPQLEYAHYSGFLVRWSNRRFLGNLLNFGDLYMRRAVGALEPDAAGWQRYLAAAVTLPVRLLRAVVP